VTVRNGTDRRVRLTYGAALTIGSSEYYPESDYAPDWWDVRQPETDLEPGEVATGLFAFRQLRDLDEPFEFSLRGGTEDRENTIFGPVSSRSPPIAL
jgi:hypothetical protein